MATPRTAKGRPNLAPPPPHLLLPFGSGLEEKSILKTRPVLHKSVAAAHASLSPITSTTMVVADLGCSSGPNTFLVVSEVLAAIVADQRPPVHVQFFLNDLPGNDFNLVFQSLEMFKKVAAAEKGEALPPYYVAGLPGSFYTRLFPDHCVHLFHSSYSLMWRSKVPEELSRGSTLNECNIYIWEATPPPVVKLYQKQFEEDFSLFLQLRHSELVSGGQMVLTFVGRKNNDALRGQVSYMWRLLAQALQSLVQQGRVEKEKLDSFDLPYYAPSVDEVKEVIRRSELFDINHVDLFESNWDPHDDLDEDLVIDGARSGVNVAKSIRAVVEPLIVHHFGRCILKDLFEMFAHNVAKHLQKVKTKYPVIVLSLKAKMHGKKHNEE
ncbi:hypothetical protein PR202_gb19965 [Eleusine coracana subsp. coracana]|uniref:Uncharacterized protein n=1 Tax=Eleusine coracana subsp. coracana TaxID=191504 RepID=A0AAV5F7B6_ELECO|nr:hypothetical protein PR202_gb19965 [Eleusine coracana subsp. coracana]